MISGLSASTGFCTEVDEGTAGYDDSQLIPATLQFIDFAQDVFPKGYRRTSSLEVASNSTFFFTMCLGYDARWISHVVAKHKSSTSGPSQY